MRTWLRPIVVATGVAVGGCSFVTTIRENTEAIGGSSAAIAANTAVVQTRPARRRRWCRRCAASRP